MVAMRVSGYRTTYSKLDKQPRVGKKVELTTELMGRGERGGEIATLVHRKSKGKKRNKGRSVRQ
jgi:hypothetical protein